MNYITHTRFKTKAICGDVNLPAMTEVELKDNMLYYQNKPLCVITSENAHNYFARNDDGLGMERGNLTQTIRKRLEKKDNQYQDRWDKIWDDELCQKYKRPEHKEHWLWNTAFYNADVEDLKYIYKLIGGK